MDDQWKEVDEAAARIACRLKLMMASLPEDDPAWIELTSWERRRCEEILGVAPSPELEAAISEVLVNAEVVADPTDVVRELRQRGFEIRRVG